MMLHINLVFIVLRMCSVMDYPKLVLEGYICNYSQNALT